MFFKNRLSKDEIAHMHGVAELMAFCAEYFGLDKGKMYTLGLLHDVGKIYSKDAHEMAGSKIMKSWNIPANLPKLIEVHGMTPEEYKEMARCGDTEIPPELVLLWYADMRVDAYGHIGTYQERLEQVAIDCGKESESFRICRDTIIWLQAHVGQYFHVKQE